MSSFEKALEWVRTQLSSGKTLAEIQSSFPEFKDGTLTINRVLQLDPPLLGYFDSNKLKLNIDEETIRVVSKVGKIHGLEVVSVPPDVHLLREGKLVAIVRSNGFAATERVLFEDLAKDVYGIGGAPAKGATIKDRWLDSLATLLGDKNFVDTLFFVIFFLLLPTTLATIVLLMTPSLIVPDLIRFGVALLMLAGTLYITRLYVRENLKQAKK